MGVVRFLPENSSLIPITRKLCDQLRNTHQKQKKKKEFEINKQKKEAEKKELSIQKRKGKVEIL